MASAYFCSTMRGLCSGEHLGGRAAAARCHPRQLRNKQRKLDLTASESASSPDALLTYTTGSFQAVTDSEVGTLVIDCEVFWCLEGSHISKGFCDEELRFLGLLLILVSVRSKNGLI